jgi:hypothetical protein
VTLARHLHLNCINNYLLTFKTFLMRKLHKLFKLIFLFWSFHSLGQTVTVTKTYSGPTVSVDGVGNYGTALPSVNFSASDFPNGCNAVKKVVVTINWRKTDGTCAVPTSANAYHNETSFRINSPSSNVILAPSNTWSGGTQISDVTTVFDQTSTTSPSGTPISGTFSPSGSLNTFNGISPYGNWILYAGDNANGDPLCVNSYSVTITVDVLPSTPTLSSTAICSGSAVNITSSCSTGTLTWYTTAAGTTTTTAPSGTLTANATYYARCVNGTCQSAVASVIQTVNTLPTITGTQTVYVNGTTTFTGSGTPAASNPYVSSNPLVATVSNGGVITGVAAGTSTITYKEANGCTATRTVTAAIDPCDAASSGNLDSDGDNVSNICDLDNDNDGILDYLENSQCGTTGTVVTTLFNENFGTQSTTNGTTSITTPYTNYNYFQAVTGTVPTNSADGSGPPNSLQDGRYTIFNNIKQTSSWAASIWQNIGDHTNGGTSPTAGRMAIFNANDNIAGLEFYKRTITNFQVNAPINASLWVMNLDIDNASNAGRILPNITINFVQNGTIIYTFDTGDVPRTALGSTSAWKNYKNSTTFIPTSNSPIEIVFINNTLGGGGNDLAIDDIVLTQSFCDTDRDGTPDYLDTDSDNDGCPDAIEGDENVLNSHLLPSGAINVASNGGVNANGVPNLVNASGAADIGGDVGQGITAGVTKADKITSVAITPSTTTICAGQNITLTATPTGTRVTNFGTTGATTDDTTIPIPSGDYSFRWYKNSDPNTTLSTTNTLTITSALVANSGDYSVEVTSLNNSCPSVGTKTLTVNALPTITGTQTVCINSTQHLLVLVLQQAVIRMCQVTQG